MANLLLSLKLGILSISILCIALVLKLSLLAVTEFAYSELPSIWTVVMTWLRPPYLYLIINGIIITIVASSKLHHHNVTVDLSPDVLAVSPVHVAAHQYVYDEVKVYPEVEVRAEYEVYKDELAEVEEKVIMAVVDQDEAWVKLNDENPRDEKIQEDEVAIPKSRWTPRSDLPEFSVSMCEKPPVWMRNTGHREMVKSFSEGRTSESKRQETLETTWKTIADRHPKPLTRHLNKSGTGGHHLRQDPGPVTTKSETFHDSSDRHVSLKASLTPGQGRLTRERVPQTRHLNKSDTGSHHYRHDHYPVMNKLETFDESTASSKASLMPGLGRSRRECKPLTRHLHKSDIGNHNLRQNPDRAMTKSETFHNSCDRHVSLWRLRKEPSMSQDELNRRVEAFINKSYEDMRLQRQKSLNQYMKMIHRSAHLYDI